MKRALCLGPSDQAPVHFLSRPQNQVERASAVSTTSGGVRGENGRLARAIPSRDHVLGPSGSAGAATRPALGLGLSRGGRSAGRRAGTCDRAPFLDRGGPRGLQARRQRRLSSIARVRPKDRGSRKDAPLGVEQAFDLSNEDWRRQDNRERKALAAR